MAIKVLEPSIASKIAAGEVVERPASVVKELLENSLDAGASKITVEIQNGGVSQIKVIDDGCGMLAHDVEMAFHRHATSKISQMADLGTISTMGFRGEALPSIASVSRVSLVSRLADTPGGREVDLNWGKLIKNTAKGCPPGTSVTVQELFENLPARRKFLKSASGESSRIGDLLSRYALAFPGIRFQLLIDGRATLTSPGTGSLADAIAAVYGGATAKEMLEASWEEPGGEYRASGFVSSPSLHRANRSYITFFVNGRWIQSPMLTHAVSESYHGFLPDKRYPVAVINLTVPLGDVDVNVHPTKREVRFRQENRVYSAVQRAVRGALIATSPVPEISIGPERPSPVFHGTPSSSPVFRPADSSHWPAAAPATAKTDQWERTLASDQHAPRPMEALNSLRIVGQVKSTYLVAEGPDGMYLIDQHAAHERVLFERVVKDVEAHNTQVQALLEPMSVELSPGQEEVVQENLELLSQYGFLLEPFGERSYLVRGIPGIIRNSGPGKALVEVLDLMPYEGILKGRKEALAASIACHSSVRAGMALNQDEMEELVRSLQGTDTPHTCPHGRPTMVHLSSHHLEREFGRR